MPMTALDIFKLLPKKNCSECGVPTCLAFAMMLANKQAELTKCPYVAPEVVTQLESSALPPMRTVKVGDIEIGGETELFRHEKKFVNQTAYALIIEDDLDDHSIVERAKKLDAMKYERIGIISGVDLIGVKAKGDAQRFSDAVTLVNNNSVLPLVLMSDAPEVVEAGLKVVSKAKPLIYAGTTINCASMAKLAKQYACPLALYADDIDELVLLSEVARSEGLEDIVLDLNLGVKPLRQTLEWLTILRRLSVKKLFRPLGFPVMVNLDNGADVETQAIKAAIGTLKYASLMLFSDLDPARLYPLTTLRTNIYTDPQALIQVNPGIYEIGKPNRDSPVIVTSNFSLTYFTVASDIEASKVPALLLVVDTEGLSVMTAFAADKFTPEKIAETLKEYKVAEKVDHRKLIIPGMIAMLKMKLEELTGWEVIVGVKDSSALPKYLKELANG
ncbi:MAG: acetyl-CoA decarbonylase/synthase complex subunit gamma [Halobacteriota archaeon]